MNNIRQAALILFFVSIAIAVAVYFRILPGISNSPGHPRSSSESGQQGLLIDLYEPSQREIIVKGERYYIRDTWTTYFFTDAHAKQVNKIHYAFLVRLHPVDFNDRRKMFDHESVRYYGPKLGIANGVGWLSETLAVDFLTEKAPIPPDSILLGFDNSEGEIKVHFVKKK